MKQKRLCAHKMCLVKKRIFLQDLIKQAIMKNHRALIEKNKLSSQKGFSLIEVLFSLWVVSMGVVAISALMSGNIKTTTNAKNQVIASSLAQEGIELVKNLKDNNPATFTSVSGEKTDGAEYRIDLSTDYPGLISNINSDKRLYLINDLTRIYSHAGTIPTKFYRKIEITNDSLAKNVIVTSFVVWNNSGFPVVPYDPITNPCNIANKCVSVVAVLPDASS